MLQSNNNNNNNHKNPEEVKAHNLKDANQQYFETAYTTTTKIEDEELGHVIRADHDYIELRVQVKEEIPETIEDFKPEIEPGDLTIDEQVEREQFCSKLLKLSLFEVCSK